MLVLTRLKRIWRFLHSRRFALILLFVLTFFIFLGVVIPQKNIDSAQYKQWTINQPRLSMMVSYLSLDDVFSAWYFYFLNILLFINTLLCAIKQIKGLLKFKINSKVVNRKNNKLSFNITPSDPHANLPAQITKFFTSHRFKIKEETSTDGAIIAYKSQWAKWGIVIFHLGLLVILGSIFYGSLTKMEGTAYLGVGQTFTDRHEDYYKINHGWLFTDNDHLGFQMTLKKAIMDYSQGYPDTSNLKLSFWDSSKGTENRQIGKRDISYQGVRIYKENVGYAPALVFTNDKNQILYATLQDLQTIFHLGNQVSYQDISNIPQLDLKVDVEFYPDAVVNGKSIYTKSQQPKNPLLYLKIWQGKKLIYDGTAKAGAKIKLADNLFLNYPEYRNWVSFRMVRDNSPAGIFTGFAICLIGLALYYLVLPQIYMVSIVDNGETFLVNIFGYTDKFKEIFKDKFDLTTKTLRDLLAETEEKDHV